MMSNIKRFTVFIIGLLVLGSSKHPNKEYLSPESIITDSKGELLYMATANFVAVIDAESGEIIRNINIPEPSTGLAISPADSVLYITSGIATGKVYVLDLINDKIISEIKVGHSPVAPVVSPNGNHLYVSNRFKNNVSVIDLNSNKATNTIQVRREPIAAVITPDGKYLYVGNFLPDVPSDAYKVSASISIIDTEKNKEIKTLYLPDGSNAIRDLEISPDGKYVYVTHVLGRYNVATTQVDRGWMNTNFLTVINTRDQEIVNSVMLDDLDMGAANPWGVTTSNDGTFLIVTHSGTHEISLIDRIGLHARLNMVSRGEKVTIASSRPEDIQNDFSFLVGLRRRIKLKGSGPRGITVAGNKIYVAEYFSGTMGIIDLCDLEDVQSKPLGNEPEINIKRRGEMLFHDALLCSQLWQSCVSCHPDSRIDGLNWDLLNDGIGNPKNTKSLLLSHKTPPVMAHGVRATAEAAVRSGFKYILFRSLSENDAVAVDEYLKNIKPVPSPFLKNGKLNKSARRGQKLFENVGCINCHSGSYFTNLKLYDVGTLRGKDDIMKRPFVVPPLIEVWRTAPYIHDGRTMSIEEAFKFCNLNENKELSKNDISDLVEYVRSL